MTSTTGLAATTGLAMTLLAASVIASTPAHAAGTTPVFAPYAAYHPGSSPAGVATGDVTGDGRPDVLLTTDYAFTPATDFSLWVYPQEADGTLGTPTQLRTTGQYGSAMAVALTDVDEDGDLDAAVSTTEGVELFAQGPAGLEPSWTVPVPDAQHAELVDVSGDGLADLVVAARTGIRVWWQIAGDFMPAPTGEVVSPGGVTELEVADVTGDGLADIVSAVGNSIVVRPQLADHSFATPLDHHSGGLNGWDRVNGIAVGDLDNDGLLDVTASVGGNKPNAWMATRFQTPEGTLSSPVLQSAYDVPESTEIADVTGDGLDDIVVVHGGWNRLGVFPQSVPGTAPLAESLFPVPYASHYDPKGLTVGDVSGDGLPDVALADYNNGLVLLRGAAEGADITAPETSITSGPSGTHRSRTATFGFAATETSTFECALDSTTDWTACTSPTTYADLAAGAHTFRVRATDEAGNTDSSPALRTIVVDGPDTTITSGPSGTVRSQNATFAFTASPAAVSFECAMDSTTLWQPCTSPTTYADLATSASHTFRVRAVSAEGLADSSPAQRTFTVDAAADLAVSLTGAPDRVKKGQTLTYTAVVTNKGPNPAGSVSLAQGLPSGLTFTSVTSSGTAACSASGSPATVSCPVGTLQPGATFTMTVRATVTASKGSLASTAVAQSPTWELDPADNSASATTTVGGGR